VGTGGLLGSGGTVQGGTTGLGGGTGGSGGDSNGGSTTLAGAGSGGTQGGTGGVSGRCPDLDDNGVLDCDETLIHNASFDVDTTGWSAETNVSLEWISTDAEGRTDSGSLGLSDTFEMMQDGSLMVGAHQCQPVNEASVYRFITQISVPGDAPDTRAGFQILLYDGPECTGMTLDTQTSVLTQGSGWQLADLTYQTPTTAKSVGLRLVSVKPFGDPPVTVLFDNVLMHAD
jgi:hypothetical protein